MQTRPIQSLLAWAFAFLASAACAQEYPARPITLIVPYSPAGVYDLTMRHLAKSLERQMNQTVIVDNKQGGDLMVGARLSFQAPSDGYTIFTPGASITTWKALHRDPPIDLARDFVPIIKILDLSGAGIFVPVAVPARTVREFIAYAKANPGKLNYGTTAPSIRLTTEWFKQLAGVEMLSIAYKGQHFAYAAMANNEIHYLVDAPNPTSAALMEQGRIRMLAWIGARRHPAFPNIPSTTEEGLENLAATNWLGVMARRGTPNAVVERLNREFGIALRDKGLEELNTKLFQGRSTIGGGTAESFGKVVEEETSNWVQVARKANIVPE